jgi:hypothetical protein
MPTNKQWQPAKKMYSGITLGFYVRKTLGRGPRELPPPETGCVIFRVRRGNGYYGSKANVLYQDKYDYFIPSSINNVESQPIREAFALAVSNWKNILTANEKKQYNKRASKGMNMSGYNLYIKEFIEANT